jgi:DNA-binding NtrC family response regulator
MVNQQQQKPPDLPEIIGPSLERHLNRIAKWKDSDEPILFLGKTGTGKELFAQYLASLNGKPFYPMNCIGIPENLFESELFGHEKGAFTGANDKRIGLIEQAGEGTVFLDEIGDLSNYTLGKILRLIQFKEFRPVGSNKTKFAACRFVAATNKNEIRQDLVERFIKFGIPTVTMRGKDIYHLLQHFLTKAGYESISLLAALMLIEYTWPGNVREIEKTCMRLGIEKGGSKLGYKDLMDDVCFVKIFLDIRSAESELFRNGIKSPFYEELKQIKSGGIERKVVNLDDSFPQTVGMLVEKFLWFVYATGFGFTPPYPHYMCHYSVLAKRLDPLASHPKIPQKSHDKEHDKEQDKEVDDLPWDDDAENDDRDQHSELSASDIFDSTTPDELKCKWLEHHLDKGMTKEEIAVKAGRSKSVIYKWIKSFGLNS